MQKLFRGPGASLSDENGTQNQRSIFRFSQRQQQPMTAMPPTRTASSPLTARSVNVMAGRESEEAIKQEPAAGFDPGQDVASLLRWLQVSPSF